jgi:rubrerythrin
MDLENFRDVIVFAIEKEKEAVEFYKHCAAISDRSAMKTAFEEMADEEQNHVRMLENFKQEHVESIKLKAIPNLKIGDYLVEMEFKPDMKYQDLLILAIKREDSAFAMYNKLASEQDEAGMMKLFQILAQEEAKHKNRLEKEYDEIVLRWN